MPKTDTALLLELMREKKAAFEEYEQQTQGMLSCPMEEYEPHMRRREELAKQVDEIDERIHVCCSQDRIAIAVIYNSCDRGGLPEDLGEVFDMGQQVFAVINRVKETEPQVVARFELARDMLLEKIAKCNQSAGALAARFYPAGREIRGMIKQMDRKV